jgi:hypothetical protein
MCVDGVMKQYRDVSSEKEKRLKQMPWPKAANATVEQLPNFRNAFFKKKKKVDSDTTSNNILLGKFDFFAPT